VLAQVVEVAASLAQSVHAELLHVQLPAQLLQQMAALLLLLLLRLIQQ
jgi:hypothetical protein